MASTAPVQPSSNSEDTALVELIGAGRTEFDLGHCARALAMWEQAFELAPEDSVIAKLLAEAHRCQYERDGDIHHLRMARSLLERYAASLAPDADHLRADIQLQLDELDVALDRAQANLDALAAATATEQPARRRATEQPLEPDSRPSPDELAQRLARSRQRSIAGTALVATGSASLVAMTVGLGIGVQANRDFERLPPVSGPEDEAEALAIARRGRLGDRLAIGAGALGGALVITGTTMMLVATIRRENLSRWSRLVAAPGVLGWRL